MKHKKLIAGILIVALVMLCVASLFAVSEGVKMAQASGVRFAFGATNVSAKATEHKTVSVTDSPSLTVTTDFGNITVTGDSPGGEVSITAEKTAWGRDEAEAQAALKDIKVVVEQDGDQVKVSVQQPAMVDAFHVGPGMGNVAFTISVPKQTTVTLHSTNGDLSLEDTSGEANLETAFGKIDVAKLSGQLHAQTTNGPISAQDIQAEQEILLTSEFGGVTLTSASAADVTTSTTNGRITLMHVHSGGALAATSDFGDIEISESDGASADAHNRNGQIQLSQLDLEGPVKAQSDFGNITLTGVNASGYDLTNQNGKISLDGAQGSIRAHSDLGFIEVTHAELVDLDLSTNNGGITFSGSLAKGPQSLKSEFGSITLTLPADSALTVDLQTNLGKITSDFDVTIQGEIDSHHWVGTINGGGVPLTAKTDNGNIVLVKSK